jgi:hypothetical protein
MPKRTAASLLAVAWLLVGANAFGQQPMRTPDDGTLHFVKEPANASPGGGETLHFTKEPLMPSPEGPSTLHLTKEPAPANPAGGDTLHFKKEAVPANPEHGSMLHFKKEAAPVTPAAEDTLHFTKEARTSTPAPAGGDALHFTKEAAPASSSGGGSLHFTKEAGTTTPAGDDALHFTKEALSAAPKAEPVPASKISVPPAKAPEPQPVFHSPYSGPASKSSNSGPAGVAKPASGVQRVVLQPIDPKKNDAGGEQEGTEYFIQLEPPGTQQIFGRLDSEKEVKERMRQEALERPTPDRIEFPTYRPLTEKPFVARQWPARSMVVEPAYVYYGRLLFENLNSERYGWDLGFVGPFVSAAHFYKDVALLPYHCLTDPFRCGDSGAGYCLPGDPVPYLLYPPTYSAAGAAAEGVVVMALIGIF